jgi:Fe-S-cluster containining protein
MSPVEITTKLCTACTLCCNGVLFADVRLQAGDDAQQLAQLGVALTASANPRFRQPCACLQGGTCRVYDARPKRCRTFECRLLQKALAGEISTTTALRTIAATKQRVQMVQDLLQKLNDVDESLPLSRRWQRMMRQPIDLAKAGENQRRGRLMAAVARLVVALDRHFVGGQS